MVCHGEGDGDGTFGSDLAGGDGVGAVAEDEALRWALVVFEFSSRGSNGERRLTTAMLMKPSTKMMMPEPMTERHMLTPRAVLLVAGLLRSPRISMPIAIMASPNATKP